MATDVVRCVIIADDLTGAADSSAGLADRGATVAILPWMDDGGDALRAALDDRTLDVLVIETDTRDRDAPTAAARLEVVAGALLARTARGVPSPLVVKKIDSILRGPIAAEVAVLRGRLAPSRTVIAPAFPRLGRTTIDGIQLREGVQVGEADIARVCGTPDAVGVPAGAPLPESAVSIHDARTEGDLAALAVQLSAHELEPLVVCSAGLLEALASPIITRLPPRTERKAHRPPVPGWTLIASLSPTTTARRQVSELVDTRSVRRVELPIAAAVADPAAADASMIAALAGALQEPSQRGAPADGTPILVTVSDQDDWAGPESPEADEVREAVLAVCRQAFAALPRPTCIVANGGDAARVVVDAWDLGRLVVDRALPHGAALVRGADTVLVLKSGGFGPAAALTDLVDMVLSMTSVDVCAGSTL